jgi:hypothetical protein
MSFYSTLILSYCGKVYALFDTGMLRDELETCPSMIAGQTGCCDSATSASMRFQNRIAPRFWNYCTVVAGQ